MELTNQELMDINGGGITAAFLTATAKLVSAIRRITSGKVCPL